jgi:hypothetical protein
LRFGEAIRFHRHAAASHEKRDAAVGVARAAGKKDPCPTARMIPSLAPHSTQSEPRRALLVERFYRKLKYFAIATGDDKGDRKIRPAVWRLPLTQINSNAAVLMYSNNQRQLDRAILRLDSAI